MRTHVAWDLEIAIPDKFAGENSIKSFQLLQAIREERATRYDLFDDWPFGITVGAATTTLDAQATQLYDTWVEPDYAPLRLDTVNNLLDFLEKSAMAGSVLVGWNTSKFDWHVVARLTGRYKLCRKLCLASYDLAFQALCHLGYMLGQDAVCKGVGLPGKPQTNMGKAAPVLWEMGEYQPVISYCQSDVFQLGKIFEFGYTNRKIKWVTRNGELKCLPLPFGWLTVEQCFTLPLPDTGWMDNPMQRADGLDWLLKGTE